MLLGLVHLADVWGKLLCQSYFWFQWKLSDEDGAFEQLGFEGAAGRLTGGSLFAIPHPLCCVSFLQFVGAQNQMRSCFKSSCSLFQKLSKTGSSCGKGWVTVHKDFGNLICCEQNLPVGLRATNSSTRQVVSY